MTEVLLKLAERCESATGSDRALDHMIACHIKLDDMIGAPMFLAWSYDEWIVQLGKVDGGGGWVPRYTASLDAAMTLVPEGWHVERLCEGPDIEPRPRDFAYDGSWSVQLHSPVKGLLHNLE